MTRRDLFLKENIKPRSKNEYKQALLTGYLSAISVGIGAFYLVYDNLYGVKDFIPYYFI